VPNRCTDHRFETYGDRLDRECREREIDQVFLAALDRLTEQRLTTSASKNSSNYAPKVMAANGGAGGFAQRDLEKAMNRLFAEGKLVGEVDLWRRSNRHWAVGLGRKKP
jgi:hypothetical protein